MITGKFYIGLARKKIYDCWP